MSAMQIGTGLRRSRTDEVLGGVLGGIAQYFGLDSGRVRIAYVVASVFSAGFGIVAYIMMWYAIPEESRDF